MQLTNLFGINEFRYTKDKVKKARFLGVALVIVMLILMLAGYVGAFAYSMIAIDMSEIIPMYLYTMAGLLILVFSFFKAGSTLFSMKGYEMMVALPVSRAAIIISRFACMYVTNLMAELLIMLPGLVVYGYFIKPAVGFYVVFILGSLFLPLLPLTISSVLGALITAISARTKHRSLVETLLMMGVVIGVMAGSMFLSNKAPQITEEMMKNMAEYMCHQIANIYPPSLWFQKALFGDWGALFLLIAIPAGIFTAFVAILQKHFQNICMAIHAVAAKNDYKMTSLKRSNQMAALWKKELKRYFSSSIYVTNTVVSYVMAVLLCAGILFIGVEQLGAAMGIPGIAPVIAKGLPFGLSAVLCLTSITSVSISMEGNTFWQVQPLPISEKVFYGSKILTNITVVTPFYLICVILLCLAVKPAGLEMVWLVVIPLSYILFSSVLGITINLAFPVLKWDNETRIVKQSASMMIAMLVGLISSILPLICVATAKEELSNMIYCFTMLILLVLTWGLNCKNNKVKLSKIGDK